MEARPRTFGDGVGAIGVDHQVEPLSQLYQTVHQSFGTLIMHVVVARVVDAVGVAPAVLLTQPLNSLPASSLSVMPKGANLTRPSDEGKT